MGTMGARKLRGERTAFACWKDETLKLISAARTISR